VHQAVRGLMNQIEKLKGSTSPDAQEAIQKALDAIQRVADALNGAGI
jgi:hypothetical protein